MSQRTLPTAPTWTARHRNTAEAQGWNLFNEGQIQRLDDADVFADDAAAIDYVRRQAARGRPEALAALALHDQHGASVVPAAPAAWTVEECYWLADGRLHAAHACPDTGGEYLLAVNSRGESIALVYGGEAQAALVAAAPALLAALQTIATVGPDFDGRAYARAAIRRTREDAR